MTRTRKLLVAGGAAVVVAAGAVGIAQAVGGDSEEQAKGPDAQRAKDAAVKAVGGGRAIGVERDDESGGAFEVEVERTDGSKVEVHLNRSFERVGVEPDDDGANEEREGESEGEDE